MPFSGVNVAGAQLAYKAAILELNVLGKATLSGRQRAYRYLRELYALDSDVLAFRALRDLWDADAAGRPLLALLCALASRSSPACHRAHDSSRAREFVRGRCNVGSGGPAPLPRQLWRRNRRKDRAERCLQLDAINPPRGPDEQKAWPCRGHGWGPRVCSAHRSQPGTSRQPALRKRMGSYPGPLPDSLRVLAVQASQRGLLEYRYGGGVVEVGFRLLLRPFDKERI